MKGQKKEEEKLIEVEGVEEWEVEKILNKRKNKGSREVFGLMERVHCRRRYLGKKGGLEECKGSLGRIRREDECRSKETRENRHGRRERL